jgi:hypothetical protein
MDGEPHSSKPGTSSRATTVFFVACAIAIGLMMASTGRNGNRCGCPFPCNPPAALSRSERIVAYCFHKNERSPTIATVEAFTREAIEAGFSEQLKDGRLEWRIVNYEEPGNEHFAADYKLAAPCVVLVRMRGNQPMEWRSLPEVWDHVGDKPAFLRFVQKNVSEFLDYVAIPGACCT